MKNKVLKNELIQRAGTCVFALALSSACLAAETGVPTVVVDQTTEITQQKRVTGVVKDNTGEAMPGVSIQVKGTSLGTITDFDGKYTLDVPAGSVLVFSFVGMQTQEVTLGNKTQIDVIMKEDAIALNEVVAIGYGVARKSDVTGSTSSVKAEELTKRPVTRIEQALQGTAPGVQVVSSSGQPGKGLSVKIRGANSITGGTEPLYVIDGQVGGDIESLNPNDIKTMEVLKDASATAIYGSRGSNGVVLITTKSGDVGKMKINFGTWFSKNKMPKKLDLMNAYEFATMVNRINGEGSFSEAELKRLKEEGGTDWHDELERSPWTQNYDMNVSGGTEEVRYRVSFNYLKQPGMILNQDYERATFRTNLDLKPYKWLDMKINLSYVQPKSRNNRYQGDLTDPFSEASIFDPTTPVRDSETGAFIHRSQKYGSNGWNPIAQASTQLEDYSQTNIVGVGTLTVHFTDWLSFTTTNTYRRSNSWLQSFRGEDTAEGDSRGSYATTESHKTVSWQNSNYFTFNKQFGAHSVMATLLYEQSKYEDMNHKSEGRQLSTDALTYYNLGLGSTQLVSSGYTSDALQSYMFRVNYSYKDRYLLTASWRIDGSSHLTDKYSNFPSVALGWNIARESFLENNSVISGLKLRASYGETGNQAVGAYATIPRISVDKPYYYDGTTATVVTPLGAPVSSSLKWEKTKQTDIGLEGSLFNGRLNFSLDFYNKDITDLLYKYDAPYYMGGESYDRNMGEINNKGFEVALGGVPVSTRSFSWNSQFTLSVNKNKVTSLDGLDEVLVNNIGSAQNGITMLKVGRPLGEFYGYKFLGTWKTAEAAEAAKYGMQPGDARFEDVNGDHVINTEDMQRIGNATPDFTFGFSNDFRYKNWTLNVMFYGSIGGQVYSQSQAYLWGGQGQARNPVTKEVMNMWTPENETDIPCYSNTSKNFINSSRYVYDASFVKLKNIALTYNVPKSLISRFFIESLEVYASAQNLFTITDYPGYDPEVNNGTNALTQGLEMGVIPNPKTYTFGLRIGF